MDVVRILGNVVLAGSLTAFVGGSGVSLAGQGVAPGSRVRVTLNTTPSRLLIGNLDRIAGDTLHLQLKDEGQSLRTDRPTYQVVPIPLTTVLTLEVSQGRHSRVGKGVLIGGAIGTAAGLLSGIGGPSCSGNGWCLDLSPAEGAALGMVDGVLIGGIIGLIAGPSERWTTVPRTGLLVAPLSRNRLGLGATIAF